MDEKNIELYEEAISTWGRHAQTLMIFEEIGELLSEISFLINPKEALSLIFFQIGKVLSSISQYWRDRIEIGIMKSNVDNLIKSLQEFSLHGNFENKIKRGKLDPTHILEEYIDTNIMLEQLIIILSFEMKRPGKFENRNAIKWTLLEKIQKLKIKKIKKLEKKLKSVPDWQRTKPLDLAYIMPKGYILTDGRMAKGRIEDELQLHIGDYWSTENSTWEEDWKNDINDKDINKIIQKRNKRRLKELRKNIESTELWIKFIHDRINDLRKINGEKNIQVLDHLDNIQQYILNFSTIFKRLKEFKISIDNLETNNKTDYILKRDLYNELYNIFQEKNSDLRLSAFHQYLVKLEKELGEDKENGS